MRWKGWRTWNRIWMLLRGKTEMTDIKELATLTAAEMDNIYLRNVPAIILEQYATRLIAAYLKELTRW